MSLYDDVDLSQYPTEANFGIADFSNLGGQFFPTEGFNDQFGVIPEEEIDLSQYPTEEELLPQIQAADADRRRRTRERLVADTQARNPNPETLNLGERALLGIGQGTFSTLEGLAGAGEAVAGGLGEVADVTGLSRFNPFARPIQKAARQVGNQLQQKSKQYEFDDTENFDSGDFSQMIGSGVASIIPTIAGGLAGGFPLAVAAGAVSQGGSTFRQARDAFLEQGDDDHTASLKALPIGVLSGGLTAGITSLFGNTGAEAIRRGITAQGIKALGKEIAKDMGLEAAEESLDQLGQGVLERFTFNPKKTVRQIMTESVAAGLVGGIVGGGVAGLREAGGRIAQSIANRPQSEPEFIGPKDQRPMSELVDQDQQIMSKFEPGEVVISKAGDAFRKVPAGKFFLDGLQERDLLTPEEVQNFADPDQRPEILDGLAERLRADGFTGIVDDQGRVITIQDLMGMARGPRGQTRQAPTPEPEADTQGPQAATPEPEPQTQPPPGQAQERPRTSGPLTRFGRTQPQPISRYRRQLYAPDQISQPASQEQERVRAFAQLQKNRPDWQLPPEVFAPSPETSGGNRLLTFPAQEKTPVALPSPEQMAAILRPDKPNQPVSPKRLQLAQLWRQFRDYPKEKGVDGYFELSNQITALRKKIINDELAKVPSNAASLRLESPHYGYRPAYILITKSAKPGYKGKWQATLFDSRGPAMDVNFDTMEQAARSWMGETLKGVGVAWGDDSFRVTEFRKGGEQPNAQVQTQVQEGETLLTPEAGAETTPAPAPNQIPQTEQSRLPKQKKKKEREQYGDLIEHIQGQIGLIRGKKSARAGTEGYYTSAYKEALGYAALRPLFSNTKGSPPDQIVDDLRRAGVVSQDFTVDDLWDELIRNAKGRKGNRKNITRENEALNKAEQTRIQFETLAFQNKRNVVAKRKVQPVPVSELLIGDELEIGGEKFTATAMHIDPDTNELLYVQLSDGKKYGVQNVNGEQVIHPDPGSYKPAPAEFLPGDGQDDIQFSLDGMNEDGEMPKFQMPEFATWTAMAQAPEGLRALIHRMDRDTFQPETRRAILAFLDEPVMKDLDWKGLQVEITDWLDSDGRVVGSRLGRMIQITTQASGATLPHEVAHVLFDFLPQQYKTTLEEIRNGIIRKRYGENAPPGLIEGMTSDEFRKSGLPISDYPLSNSSELFAHFMGNEYAQKSFQDRNGQTFWRKAKAWLQAIWDALRRTLGLKPDMDRMFREFIAGRFKPDMQSIIDREAEYSFYDTAKKAQQVETLSTGTFQQKTEGAHALAQGHDFVDLLNKHGANTASPGAQALLRYADYLQYRASGENLNGRPQSYRDLKTDPRFTPAEKTWMSVVAARQAVAFDSTLAEAQRQGALANQKLSSPSFLKSLAREAKLKTEMDQAEAVNRASGPVLESALKMAQKALMEAAENDAEAAQIQAQLNEIDEARKSSAAMSQLITDMIRVISATPGGQTLLGNPNVTSRELLDLYKDLKRSTNQPMHSEGLMRWAGFILERNADLRDQLWAAQLSQNPTILAAMGPYELKLFADLRENPAYVIMRERRLAKKLQTKEDRARFAWWQLHKKNFDLAEPLIAQVEGGQIAASLHADPDYVSLRNEMFKDAGMKGRGKLMQPYSDQVLVLPSGAEVDISPESFRGSKVSAEMWNKWDAARKELAVWINSHPNHPDVGLRLHEMNELETHYFNESVLSPHDREGIFDGAATNVEDSIRYAGGSLAASVITTANRWRRMKEQSGLWRQRYSHELTILRAKSMASHGNQFRHDANGGKEQLEIVNRRFYKDHLNQILYSLNRQAGPMRVGDRTKNGTIVTKEDLADAKFQSDIASKGFKIIEDNFGGQDYVVEDYEPRSQTSYFRTPSRGSENTVPRKFESGRDLILKEFAEARKAKNVQAQINILNANWRELFYEFVWDRNPEFATPTPFDGPGQAFELAAGSHASIPDFDAFMDFLVANSAATKPEAQDIVLAEWGRIINRLAEDEAEKSKLIINPVVASRVGPTTKARGPALAPYGFYRYGFGHSGDISRFQSTIHARAIERLLSGLSALEKELQDRITKLGQSDTPGKTIARQEEKRRTGQDFETYQNLQSRLNHVTRVIRFLSVPDPEDTTDIGFRRLSGNITGSVVSNVMTTARNVLAGGKFIGGLAQRLNAKSLFDYPAAFWYTLIQEPVLGVLHVGYSIGKAGYRTLPALGRAVRETGSPLHKGRRTRAFFGEAFKDAMFEVTDGIRERYIPDLNEKGLTTGPDLSAELQARALVGFIRAGQLLEDPLSLPRRIAQGAVSFPEVGLMWFRGLMPAIGDYANNKAIAGVLMSWPGGFRRTRERALNKVYKAWQQSNYRSFNFADPKDRVNQLSHQELGYSDANELESASVFMLDASLSLQEEAMKYLQALNQNHPKPEFLTGDSYNLFVEEMLGQLNKSTATNKPIFLEGQSKAIQFIRPLMGWRIRTLNTLAKLFARNARSDKGRATQWMVLATFGLLPFLLWATASNLAQDEIARLISKYWYGNESASRRPWEHDTTRTKAFGWSTMAIYDLPFLDMVMNLMFGNVPARSAMQPQIFLAQKFQDVFGYVGGVLQTGDPRHGLAKLITSTVPETKTVLNRMESERGKTIGRNVVNLIKRFGPEAMLEPQMQQMSGALQNVMSPFGPAMENAALSGDWKKLETLFNQAVVEATNRGDVEPEQTVQKLYLTRNPFRRPFKGGTDMTDEQMATFKSKLDPEQLKMVEKAESDYESGADLIGANAYLTKEANPRYREPGVTRMRIPSQGVGRASRRPAVIQRRR